MDKNINDALIALNLKKVYEEIDQLKSKSSVTEIKGRDGRDGIDGKNGIDGKDGIDGKNGIDGKDGKDGRDGADGKDGTDGRDGIDGTNGRDGIDGKDGKDGIDGRDGADGKDGIKGDKGEKGDKGDKGEKGDKGDKGKDGRDGIDGKNGLNGKDGRDGIDGKDGIDGRDGIDGKDGRDGKDGEKGEKGDVGPAGKDGVTPDIEPFIQKAQKDFNTWRQNVNKALTSLGGGGVGIRDVIKEIEKAQLSGSSGNANITVSENPPTGVSEGALWWASDEGQLYIYYDDQWIQAAESVLAQEDIPTDISDLTDNTNLLFSGSYTDLTSKPTIPSTLTDLGITDGTSGQVLTTNGAGGFTFANSTGGDIVSDTSPQLGGNLNLNTHNITGTGSILTTGDIQITGAVSAGGNIISSQLAPSNGDLTLRSSIGGTANGARIALDGDNVNANITLDPFGSGIVDVQSALTATGDVTGYAFNGRIGSITGTTVDASFYPVFVSAIQPDQYLEAHSGLSYNPNSGILTATRFNGGFAGTLAADLNAQSFAKIINLPTPTNAGDAASKNYVDNQIAGITGFATESYVNTYVNARTQDLADNRGVWVRNADYVVNTGDFNRVIPFDAELVTSTIPNFSHSSGVFQNTDSRTRRFLFQMHVAIKATSGQYNEADIWFSYNGTYSGSNRRGQVNFVNDDTGVYNCMLTTSWTFTLAQNETVRCYVWAQTPYKVGGGAFGNDRSCLVEVQELN